MVVDGGDSLLRAWTLDMLALTVGRSSLQTHLKLEGMLQRTDGIANVKWLRHLSSRSTVCCRLARSRPFVQRSQSSAPSTLWSSANCRLLAHIITDIP
jgi:hypothetical protein